MTTMTVQQRRALRYAVAKAEGDREVRAAEQLMHADSSTPSLQRFFESPPGVATLLAIGLVVFVLFAPVGVL